MLRSHLTVDNDSIITLVNRSIMQSFATIQEFNLGIVDSRVHSIDDPFRVIVSQAVPATEVDVAPWQDRNAGWVFHPTGSGTFRGDPGVNEDQAGCGSIIGGTTCGWWAKSPVATTPHQHLSKLPTVNLRITTRHHATC